MSPTAAAAASNPYLQSMYAAAAASANSPYAAAGTGLPANAATAAGFQPLAASLNLAAAAQTPLAAATGNPLLDAYASQYAALYAATGANPAAGVNGAGVVGTSADVTAMQQASKSKIA